MNWVKKAWRGEEKLWKVFWIYDILGGFLLVVINKILGKILGASLILGISDFVIWIVFCIWITVSLWRCAFNLDWKFWGYIARIWAVFPILMLTIGFIVGSILSGSDMIAAAEERQCERIIKAAEQSGVDPKEYIKQSTEPHFREQDKIKCLGTYEFRKEKSSKLNPELVTYIMDHFEKCWSVPDEMRNVDNAVALNISLLKDGSVSSVEVKDKSRYNSDLSFRKVADSAVNAVNSCTPLKNMPADKFSIWKDMVLTFDPKFLPQ